MTIHQSAVRRASMLNDGVGYIDLKAFSDSTAKELNGAITSLLARGMKTLVLDMPRTNPADCDSGREGVPISSSIRGRRS